uniref:tRNA pseudouridine synthase Pus10 n=1 Tax=Amphilophus citrinellus TaxID=61819 RepID=A0A3Q0RL87_AMPCI
MLPLKEKDKPIIQKLLAAGCCARCVLRFCCVSVQAAYRQPPEETLKELQAFIKNIENGKCQDSVGQDSTDENKSQDTEEAATAVRLKDGNSVLDHTAVSGVFSQIAEAVKAGNYEFDTLVLSLSLPAQLCVREHSCWLHVKKEVREKGLVLNKDDVIQVKEAFKWIMQGMVAKELGGVAVSPFESVFTRMAVVKALEKIPDAKFLKHYPCPPRQPSSSCSPREVQCLHVSVFVAGRYNKFCRSLPQTPWVIDGERRMESSVEELIAAPILSAFRADGFNFSSSGREDVDVRTLGNGRPFAMELLNPHKSRFSKVQMKQLQETINESSDKIKVRDLQIVTREAMGRMKEGEEEKTKSYTALVWTQKTIQREDISFIDNIKDLTLNQKTPLRVLHRRALAVRQRTIHSMSTRFLDSHHFYLGLKTQAGTYIKEFVHGDFGRTNPNLCQLLKTDTDILELDVESVDVDWPPPVPE